MGMAASQARFLGLTARKSNVEYQGQQVNQQRTALANESANLYSQMMNLNVPVPPSQTDYYKTVYTLEGSKESYLGSDYTIETFDKTYNNNNENEYSVTLANKVESITGLVKQPEFTSSKGNDGKYSITFTFSNPSRTQSGITYDPNQKSPLKENGTFSNYNSKQIYSLEGLDQTLLSQLTGYQEALKDLRGGDANSKATFSHFYKDEDGFHFLTEDDMTKITAAEKNNNASGEINSYGSRVYYKEELTTVIATMDETDNGRFSTITIENNENYPDGLRGETFNVLITQEKDEAAYEDAFNEYEYQKTVYEQAISEINAQTEIVQRQDQKLELRLDQLDTEQQAISTEMDSVTKVIDDNIEKTFKAFA